MKGEVWTHTGQLHWFLLPAQPTQAKTVVEQIHTSPLKLKLPFCVQASLELPWYFHIRFSPWLLFSLPPWTGAECWWKYRLLLSSDYYRLLTFSNYLQTTYSFSQTTSRLPQFSKDYFHFKTTPIFRTLPDHSQFLNYTQNIPIFILLTTTTQNTPNPLIFSDYSNSQINQDYSHFIPLQLS